VEGDVNELDFLVALVTVTVLFLNYLVISIVIVIKQRKQLLKRVKDKIRAIRKN
jgi:heme exporter protein D